MTQSKCPKARYKAINWPEYSAALRTRRSLTVWLDKDMHWYAPASVSADGAYDTKARHAAILERGLQGVIPPRQNAQRGKPRWKG